MALPSTLPTQLSSVISTFNGPSNLGSYLRGGTYVPNDQLSGQALIPTSYPLNLSTFITGGQGFAAQWTISTGSHTTSPYEIGYDITYPTGSITTSPTYVFAGHTSTIARVVDTYTSSSFTSANYRNTILWLNSSVSLTSYSLTFVILGSLNNGSYVSLPSSSATVTYSSPYTIFSWSYTLSQLSNGPNFQSGYAYSGYIL
jgi:hypothetical protein